MRIVEMYSELESVQEESITVFDRTGTEYRTSVPVITEHLLDVYVNDILTMKLTCTPQYLTELVLGRLVSEGMIESTEEIDTLYICQYGLRAKVFLNHPAVERVEDDYVETIPTCCTGNRVLNDYFDSHKPLEKLSESSWTNGQVFQLYEKFREDTPLHRATHSTHSAILMHRGEICFGCEDIGRHNALDKAIGYALRENIEPTSLILFTSGRVATDMAVKAIRAGIPVLVSKEAPTEEAVFLAREYKLRLIRVKNDIMVSYS